MPKKIRFIKKCDEGKVGQIKNYSNPSADSLVEQGYAEYFDKPREKEIKNVAKELAEKSGLKKDELRNFIFDKNQIIQKRVFTSHQINNHAFGFGLLLPRDEEVTNKKGEVINIQQVWKPVIITSECKGLVVSKLLEREQKLKYDTTPSEMPLRWELEDIRKWKDGEVKPINPLKLFKRVREQYEKYNNYRDVGWYDVNPLWDIATYCYQLFSAFPLKEERGLKTTGKSKTMLLSSFITLNGTELMINPSEATLFRLTEELRPTKYFDEAEKLFNFYKGQVESDLRAELINASYSRNGVVPRQEKILNKFITKWYHCYSPTRIASIKGLYGATETRAITQIHTKASLNDIRGELDPENDRESSVWSQIRNGCYVFVLQNWKQIKKEDFKFNEKIKIKQRDLQLWKPLLVLAKIIDKDLFERVKIFAEKISKQRQDDFLPEGSLEYTILGFVKEMLDRGTTTIYVNDIKKRFKESNPEEKYTHGFNKTISTRLDNLGFKDLRKKDRDGAYFDITKNDFDSIVSPICPYYSYNNSSQSSQSSQLLINDSKICDEQVTNVMNNNNKEKEKCDECDECDDGDDGLVESKKTKIEFEKVI